jgi:hypothetical protein
MMHGMQQKQPFKKLKIWAIDMIEYIHIGNEGCGKVAMLCDHVLQPGEVIQSKYFKKPDGQPIEPNSIQQCYSCGAEIHLCSETITPTRNFDNPLNHETGWE